MASKLKLDLITDPRKMEIISVLKKKKALKTFNIVS